MIRALFMLISLLVLGACDAGGAPGTPGSLGFYSGGDIVTYGAVHSTK